MLRCSAYAWESGTREAVVCPALWPCYTENTLVPKHQRSEPSPSKMCIWSDRSEEPGAYSLTSWMPHCNLDIHHALLHHRSCCCLSKLTCKQLGENRRLSKVTLNSSESDPSVESSKSLFTQRVEPNQQRHCFGDAPQHQRSNFLAELGFVTHVRWCNGEIQLIERPLRYFYFVLKHFCGSTQC